MTTTNCQHRLTLERRSLLATGCSVGDIIVAVGEMPGITMSYRDSKYYKYAISTLI
jgi:hypothetical protein